MILTPYTHSHNTIVLFHTLHQLLPLLLFPLLPQLLPFPLPLLPAPTYSSFLLLSFFFRHVHHPQNCMKRTQTVGNHSLIGRSKVVAFPGGKVSRTKDRADVGVMGALAGSENDDGGSAHGCADCRGTD